MKNKKKDFAAAFEEAINALDLERPKEEVLLPLLHLAVEASQLQLALANISYTLARSIIEENRPPIFPGAR
jgi:hypothetical protein